MLPKTLVAASLKPILLSLLDEGEKYGYQIIHQTQVVSGGKIKWTASKLYPMLHKMEHEELVEAFWKPSESGPDRKYYRITPAGRTSLASVKEGWGDMIAIMARLWGNELNLNAHLNLDAG